MYSLCQPHAERFGRECQLDPKYIVNFGEEVVRGQPVFALSLLLATLEPMLRSTAGVASWSVSPATPCRTSANPQRPSGCGRTCGRPAHSCCLQPHHTPSFQTAEHHA